MKFHLLLFCLICTYGFGFSQNKASDFTGNKSDQPRNFRNDQMNFVPNEILVKFNDAVPVASGARVKAAGVSSVDQVLKSHGITSLEKLFPSALKQQNTRMMKSPQGKDITIPALDKIYRVSVPPAQLTDSMRTNIFQLIDELKALPEVEYAEPNYIYSIDGMQPVGPILTAEDVKNIQTDKPNNSKASYLPNDPLFGQQWYIPAVEADMVWEQSKGDSTQIIAILDTGVDWNHPDLKNKIWINPNPETKMSTNGILNDIRGWDFINNDKDPMDDNSHGTHVAGIAAAETNNGIGIAGICPKARIMPIKVFQSSGKGDVATIAKGINYAASHGATVINMSFGSYAKSLTMENALSSAYATCILVAAAGNDNLPIAGKATQCGETNLGAPSYPAALSYVLGVQAPEACFSNYDQDGPIFSSYTDLLNYEMKAPGTNILSTVPNGNYRVFQGTSMAAPIVAGVAALYRSMRPAESQEMLFGNLINSISTYVDIQKALSIVPTPQLAVVSYELTDTLDGDKDGRPDVGETIELKVKVRNTWGKADNVKVGIEFKEFEDQTTATILTSETPVGSVSAYATGFNVIPLKLILSKDIADGRDVNFVLKTWYGDHQGETSQPITINIENGIELKGIINSDMTLYPDKQYIVTENIAIPTGVTLTIKPGTTLKFGEGKSMIIAGKVYAIGKRDSIIKFTKRELQIGWKGLSYENNSNSIFKFITMEFGGYGDWGTTSISISNENVLFSDCLFTNNSGIAPNFYNSNITFSNFYMNNYDCGGISGYRFTQNNVIDNFNKYSNLKEGGAIQAVFSNNIGKGSNIFSNTNLYTNTEVNLSTIDDVFSVFKLDSTYFGTTNVNKINNCIFDFTERGEGPWIDISNKMNRPSRETHGIVWKVVVNSKDAQDEFDQLDPLGVGKQMFEVYFNRAMDVKYLPSVTMGVRSPYTQTVIAEDGTWSADSTKYTVYKNIGLTTGDGINTIRVSGAKDIDHFEIPIEDKRFRVVISAANSTSMEFIASAGLGKVNLEWNNNKLADGLGYNLYRMEHINDSTLTKPILINKTLVADTLYTDFVVTPNKKYYYYYKIVRTDLSETDSSRVVSAIPFTASKGDANGDLNVNVLDITTIVAYLLNNNPQPFIFEAADMNSDAKINVLDIVGVVNKVLTGSQKVKGISLDQQANLYLQNDTLFADVNVPVGGIQFDISGDSSIADIQNLQALQGFESGYSTTETGLRLLYYSMSGKSIPACTHIPLFVLKKGSIITDAIFGGTNGSPIRVNFILTRIPDISYNMNQTVAELGQNFPNPLNGQTTIPIHIYEPVDEAVVRIVNMMGQEVGIIRIANPYIGEHLLSWNPGTNKGLFVYTLEVINNNQKQICPNKKMIVQ